MAVSVASAAATAAASVAAESAATLLQALPLSLSPLPPLLPPLAASLASAAAAATTAAATAAAATPTARIVGVAAGIAAAAAVASRIAATVAASPSVQSAALAAVAAAGDIPHHVALIMDGNRRWARASALDAVAGYPAGSDVLLDTLRSCLALGVATVTVYAFSIENFKRPPSEVSRIMELATQMLTEMLSYSSLINAHRIRVRLLGDRSLFPPPLRAAAARAEVATRDHDGPTLNIAFAYTSRHEMAAAVATLVAAVDDGRIPPHAITPAAVEACLFTGPAYGGSAGGGAIVAADAADAAASSSTHPTSPLSRGGAVDLLVRTSGERRLSDFLCWQGGGARLAFCPVLWPDFSAWELLRVVLAYQAAARTRRRHAARGVAAAAASAGRRDGGTPTATAAAAGGEAPVTAVGGAGGAPVAPLHPAVAALVSDVCRRHYAAVDADAAVSAVAAERVGGG